TFVESIVCISKLRSIAGIGFGDNFGFAVVSLIAHLWENVLPMSAFIGRWTLLKSENFDAYMKQCGVRVVTRRIAATLKPALTVTCEGGKWKFLSESTFKTIVFEFELDKEFVEITGDGRKFMSKVTMNGDKMIQQQKAINPGDKDSHFERYVDEEGHLIMICECEGVVSKRTYKRAE
uniref:Lipocalin/cytosolic fatty-acid binding domain-containing protein n=2 Tax=Parascaris univalens TaxID=6257 RepID=A0A915BBG2_PARUN